jgi:ankyrin repeat protein
MTALINDKGCDINQRDSIDRTPLAWAAGMGHEEMVMILLEREDVDPSLPDNYDRTPLGWVALDGHEEVVKLLLGRGMSTPIMQIILVGHHSGLLLSRDMKDW